MNNMEQVARTNQILRERIALGLTGGVVKGSVCAPRSMKRGPSGKRRCTKYIPPHPPRRRRSGSKRVVKRRSGPKGIRHCIDLQPTRSGVLRCTEYEAGPKPGTRRVARRGSKRVGYKGIRHCVKLLPRRSGVLRCKKFKPGPGKRRIGSGEGLYENMYGGCEMDGMGYMDGGCEMDYGMGDGVLIGGRRRLGSHRSTSPWISFLKKYARQNGMSYCEALQDPDAQAEYHEMMGH